MINGFVLEIKNAGNQNHMVSLFQNLALPQEITVNALNTEYDYKALCLLASNKGFKGSGFNADQALEITIHNGALAETHITKFLPDTAIEIDGLNKYITVNIPANSKVIFQLMADLR